jgi:proteasome-associated ATPase
VDEKQQHNADVEAMANLWLDAEDEKGPELAEAGKPMLMPEPEADADAANAVKQIIEKLETAVAEQQDTINQLTAPPIYYATVFSENHVVDPSKFEYGDRVQLLDEEHEAYLAGIKKSPIVLGKIVSSHPVVSEAGKVTVEFPSYIPLFNKQYELNIGLGEEKAQVCLMLKNDGTNVVVVKDDGSLAECRNHNRFDPKPGEIAKINGATHQIEGILQNSKDNGLEVCKVVQIVDENTLELEAKNGSNSKLVVNKTGEQVKVGDRVGVAAGRIAIRLFADEDNKYKVKGNINVTWNDIGGQEQAKDELREAIELPALHPDIFQFYGQNPPKGVLLYGPPGCGKTMLGKATANALATIHGKDSVETGFNYIKGPEMLSMWVGNTEQNVRALFEQGRRHFEEHGYPCVTFVDEADSILQERGGSGGVRSERYHDSMVAQWLAEMDGLEAANQIVIFATNRPHALDGALTREGRVDRHIKVRRPKKQQAMEIFKIHLKNVPLHEVKLEELAEIAADELWVDRPLYIVESNDGKKLIFGLTDCVSGAMIAGLIQDAKGQALKRDLKTNQKIGLTLDDVKEAVGRTYIRHRDLNHRFDLIDFYEENGIEENSVKTKKIAIAS